MAFSTCYMGTKPITVVFKLLLFFLHYIVPLLHFYICMNLFRTNYSVIVKALKVNLEPILKSTLDTPRTFVVVILFHNISLHKKNINVYIF